MIYMCPVQGMHDDFDGYILSLSSRGKIGHDSTMNSISNSKKWILDNGAFVGKYDRNVFLQWQERYDFYCQSCVGVVVPDVVGDYKKTLDLFYDSYESCINPLYKKCLVTQDGLKINDVPWGLIDCLFIGGSDHHKLKESWKLMNEAVKRGKWIHVGRVNSAKRIKMFWFVDSVDGSTIAIDKSKRNINRIKRAIAFCNAKKSQGRLL